MSAAGEPGWYQDPTGRPGDARWWDGHAWTYEHLSREQTSDDPQFRDLQPLTTSGSAATGSYSLGPPQSLVGTDGSSSFLPARAQHTTALMPPPGMAPAAAPGPQRTSRTGVFIAIGVLAVIAVLISVLVATGVFEAKDPSAEPGPNPTGNYDPPDPDRLRVIDKSAGISYDYLGEGWKEFNFSAQIEFEQTVGQYIVTQPSVPSGGQFVAQVTSGLLSAQFGTPGPGQFATALVSVEKSVRSNYYPLPNTPTNAAEGELTIDGHQAYRRSFDLTWDVAGYDSTGERVVLILIDTGKSSPALVYCSFPNTHAELYPLIDELIASITVDG